MIKPPIWLLKAVVLALQEIQLAEHGGQPGLRDENLLESALARPQNLLVYGSPDIFDLAAAYAYGLARNHPFIDGNKRASFVASFTFLAMNGYSVTANQADRLLTWMAIADGRLTEAEIANWFRANCI